jgi:uncharacterized protein (DUF488 family)
VIDLADNAGATFFTIGHSTWPIETFVDILKSHGIRTLVDVRTIPRSRHNPQFNKETLPGELEAAGIRYVHEPGLGGLRRAKKDSPNGGWRNSSFRGFADYAQTSEFAGALQRLIGIARDEPTAIMCAEAVPWRCHRSLIADALVIRGFSVDEIIGPANCRPHVLTPWAKVHGTSITYPPQPKEPTEKDQDSHRRRTTKRGTITSRGKTA